MVAESAVPVSWDGSSVFSENSKPAVWPITPSRYCALISELSWNRPFSASTRSTLSWVFRITDLLPSIGARLSFRIFRACSVFLKVIALPMLLTAL